MSKPDFKCGHPRSPENVKQFGILTGCATCYEKRRETRRALAQESRARLAEMMMRARKDGLSTAQIAERFGVSLPTVYRYAPEDAPAFTKDPTFTERAIKAAANAIRIEPADLISPLRTPRLVRARWAVMMAMRNRGVSLPRIGRRFGRDHSTVIYGIQQAELELARSETFRDLFQRVNAA